MGIPAKEDLQLPRTRASLADRSVHYSNLHKIAPRRDPQGIVLRVYVALTSWYWFSIVRYTIASVDYYMVVLYIIYVPRINEIAHVFQGLARSGRGAGIRRGEWPVRLVESSDIQDDGWLDLRGLREIDLVRSRWTQRYLIRPFDILITARTGSVQSALVPPQVSMTVAGVTLLVIQPKEPESGMGHYLWYFLTSVYGRSQLVKRLTVNATITTLPASAVGEIEVPMPSPGEFGQVVRLVEASEEAYISAVQAARLRRDTVRDSVIQKFIAHGTSQWV